MKKSLERALSAKQAQRQRTAQKSVAQKLAVLERLRDRSATIKGRAAAAAAAKGARSTR